MSVVAGGDFVLGVDFGTDSVRAIVADPVTGALAGSAASDYARWARGLYCDPASSRFRQHPLDYLEGMETAVRGALAQAGAEAASRIRGLCVDTTGSTPCMADGLGRPLALSPEFAEDPDAMFVLWKDHTAIAEADRLNALARSWGGEDFTKYEGGIYSPEWFWAKALRIVGENPAVAAASRTIVEHCDWMPALLAGVEDPKALRRSRCAAGHKAMWHASWGGYPPAGFLTLLHPRLADLAPSLGAKTWTAGTPAGRLCPEWAARLGLPAGAVVSVGALDAHMGAVGGLVAPGTLLKIMGTSTCDILVAPRSAGPERLARGICGQVDGSVIPGMIGYEAGQSAFGDVFAWFRDLLAWPSRNVPGLPPAADAAILPALEAAASAVDPAASGLVALDWLNGRRTPDSAPGLTGAIAGLKLGTGAPEIYRALVEAVAFGSRAIAERLREEGVPSERVAAVGGVARKSPLVVQTTADILGMEIEVASSEQSCALGAAMFAAVAAGLHPDVGVAQRAMGAPPERVHRPDPARRVLYDRLYARYRELGAFVESSARG